MQLKTMKIIAEVAVKNNRNPNDRSSHPEAFLRKRQVSDNSY